MKTHTKQEFNFRYARKFYYKYKSSNDDYKKLGQRCIKDPNHFKIFKWLNDRYVFINDSSLIKSCCEFNNLPILKLINKDYYVKDSLILSCTSGYIDMSEWLLKTFPKNEDEHLAFKIICGHQLFLSRLFGLFSIDHDCAFRFACGCGNLKLAKWLVETYIIDIRSNRNNAIRTSCSNGHIDVAQWLTKSFNLNSSDIKTINHAILRNCCVEGHIHILKWIFKSFKYTQKEITSRSLCPILLACQNGHLNVLKLLIKQFNIDQISPDYFKICCQTHENHHIVKWILKQKLITMDDEDVITGFKYCCSLNHDDIVKWFFQNGYFIEEKLYAFETFCKFDVIIDENFPIENFYTKQQQRLLFREHCYEGNLKVVKFLKKKFAFSYYQVMDMSWYQLIHVNVNQWLKTNHKFTLL